MRSIALYYWLTPLFWLVDEFAGANLRTAALDGHPWWKALYYMFCMAIPIIAYRHTGWTSRLALVESSANVLLLVLAVIAPYYGFIHRAALGEFPTESPITMEKMVNFILATAVWFISFQIQLRNRALEVRSRSG